METTQTSTFTAFEHYQKQEYESCIAVLNKLKSARTQNEKLSSRIHHNLALCEFMNGKMSNVNNFLNKLEEVLNETKSKVTQKRKDSSKSSTINEEDTAETSGVENNDDILMKYNHAIVLNLAGKRNKSIETLKEIFQNKDLVYDYVTLKSSLNYLDLAINTKDFVAIKSILEFLENIKKNIGIAHVDFDSSSYDSEEGNDSKKGENKKLEKEAKHYNPLIFGTEVYKHGEIPLRTNRVEFDFALTIYHICLLVSLKEIDLAKKKLKACKSAYNEFCKVIKEGKNDKNETSVTYAPILVPYLEKHSSILFSFAKAYLAYQMQTYTKCIKLMNTPEGASFSEEEGYTCYQLNNIACCHLRMQKYALAAYYFSKALNILQKIQKKSKQESSPFKKYDTILNHNALQQYPFILHNYALALFQINKYDEAAEIYTKLAEFWPDNPKIWYRLGLCFINKYKKTLENNQMQNKNSLYQSLLDRPKYSTTKEEEKGENPKNKNKEISNKGTQYYPRFILNVRNDIWQSLEEETNLANGNRYINRDQSKERDNLSREKTKQLASCLNQAAKNSTMVARKKKLRFQKDQPLQVVLRQHDPHRLYDDPEESKSTENTANEEEDKGNSMTVKLTRNTKEYEDILQSSLMYLAYISLCNGEINNAINYAKSCLELSTLSDENKYICFMYLVEAHCILGKQKEALSEINTLSLTQSLLICAQNVLGVNQTCLMRNLSSKVMIYTNLATIHLLNNNITGAQSALESALKSLDPGMLQTPPPLLNLMIYLNLKLDKPDVALQILKRRRIDNAGNVLLNIVKPLS